MSQPVADFWSARVMVEPFWEVVFPLALYL